MPSTVNGIGTWYYGKSNLVTRNDACEFCHNYAELKSYDTTLYFVVFFIPLIPLGKKRIIDECPRCRKHRAAKLGEWEKRKTEAILQAAQAWQQDRGNKVKAIQAVAPTVAFHDPESFRQIASTVGDAFAKDADVQIYLGDAYDHFGDATSADTAYRAAVVVRPDEPSKESLGKFLLRQNRPAEAQPLLAHVLANRVRAKAPMLLALGQSYQSVGDHASAEKLIDDVGTAFPDLLSDPNYEKIRRNVSKYRGTNKPVGGKKKYDGAKQTSWFSRHAGAAIIGGILLVAAIWYLGLAYSLRKHNVALVNGTNAAYTVDINGQKHSVPAMGSRLIELDEGTYNVSVSDKKEIEPSKIQMRTNFWKRPMNRRQFVINPDRAAVVLWEQTEYADTASAEKDLPHHIHAGDSFYDLDKVDYVFEAFPDSIKLSSSSDVIKKSRVGLLAKYSPDMLGRLVKSMLGGPAAAQWAKQYAVVSNNPIESVAVLAEQLTPEEQVEFLRAHVADRPLRIEWHRMYQQLVQTQQPDFDLLGEYRGLLKSDPDNPTLIYLVARITDDREQATALFRQAAEAPQPSAYASYALAHDQLIAGNLDASLQRIQAARKLEPDNVLFQNGQVDTLQAMGRRDEAIALLKSMEKRFDHDYAIVGHEIALLVASGDTAAARKRIDDVCAAMDKRSGGDQEARANLRDLLETYLHYANGDLAAFRKSAVSLKSPEMAFDADITDGRVEDAQKALADAAPPEYFNYVLLYIGANSAGKADVASAAWTRSMELLAKGDRDNRNFAKALSTGQPPTDKELANWTAQPVERAAMLTALGLRFPDKRAAYFADAKRLNYVNQFPQLLLTKAMATP
jgi:tetratricopeptide (TPR) repeat protein